MKIDPAATAALNIYKLLVGVVVPRPIAFVSSVSSDGVYNLAPFSFFTVASVSPPIVCFSPIVNPDGRRKDTIVNAEQMKEYVINIVSEDIVRQANETSADFPPEIDEFAVSGLTPVASDLVAVPRVGEAHVSMECRLRQIVEISALPLGGSLVIGEVVRFHIDDAYFDDFRIDPARLGAVGRMAGSTYSRTTDRFELARPTLPPKPA